MFISRRSGAGSSSLYLNRTTMKLQCQMFKAPYLHSCGRYRHIYRLSFCKKLNFEQFLFDPFIFIKCNFSFQYNIIFNPINLSSPISPHWGEKNVRARGLFSTKFNSELLLIEIFLCDAYFWQH